MTVTIDEKNHSTRNHRDSHPSIWRSEQLEVIGGRKHLSVTQLQPRGKADAVGKHVDSAVIRDCGLYDVSATRW